MPQSGDPLVGRALGRDGQYRLTGVLGRGGMATVYRAEHVTPAWTVARAIKVLDPGRAHGTDFGERFQREARIVAELEHPNILPVFDYGETDGLPYLVMRLVPDGTLKDWFVAEHERPWPLVRVQWLADQILPALDAAHARGVVHRDVKPSNILISRDPPWAFLGDFGIAKLATGDVRLTGTGGMVGTPAYMAPEQVQGHAVDGRADLYGFGIVLYELLAGRVPFIGETPTVVAFKHVHEPLPDPRTINPALSPAIAAVLARALARSPARRFASGEALQLALGAATTGARARPPSRLASIAVAAVLLVIAVALGGAFLMQNAAPIPQAAPATVEAPLAPTSAPTLAPPPTPSGPTPTAQASPGTVLLQDDFSDPLASRMPLASADASKLQVSIESGEYRMQTRDPSVPNELVRLPGAYGDVSIAVDARLVGEVEQRLLVVGCRGNPETAASTSITAGYFLLVLPGSNGSVQLMRRDSARWQMLSEARAVPMRSADQRNRLELRCVGTTISAAINGQAIVEQRDGTYTSGQALLGVAARNDSAITSDVRFSNVVVTQR